MNKFTLSLSTKPTQVDCNLYLNGCKFLKPEFGACSRNAVRFLWSNILKNKFFITLQLFHYKQESVCSQMRATGSPRVKKKKNIFFETKLRSLSDADAITQRWAKRTSEPQKIVTSQKSPVVLNIKLIFDRKWIIEGKTKCFFCNNGEGRYFEYIYSWVHINLQFWI